MGQRSATAEYRRQRDANAIRLSVLKFNEAWEAYKRTPEYKRLIQYLFDMGDKLPYAENKIHHIFSAGYHSNKHN